MVNLKDQLVVKSNDLIQACTRLSLVEAKIIIFMVGQIKQEDKTFNEHHIHVKKILEDLNLGERNHEEIIKAAESLLSRTATLYQSEGILKVNFLSSAKYYTKGIKRGMLRLRFDPCLKPYLLQLREKFTSYKIGNILNLKSVYSLRIYELLKQYENIRKRKITLPVFREILGFKKTEYKQYNHFKTRVILPAQRELKQKTDISFEFEEIKEGRSVAEIEFFIYPNKEQEKPLDLFEDVMIKKMQKIVVFSQAKMRTIIEQYNEEKIEIALQYTKNKAKTNKEGYFLGLLNDPNFGEAEIEARKKRERKEERENQEYIKKLEEEAQQKREKEQIEKYIKKHPKIFEKFISEFHEINGEKYKNLSESVQNSMAKNYARIEILKEIKKEV